MILCVEGLPGSGKSTTARRLAAHLTDRGQVAQCIAEGHDSVGLPWTYARARETLRRTTVDHYPFDSWTSLPSEQVTVVDAKLLQSTSLFAMLQERDDEIDALPLRILASVAQPVRLVVFEQSDPVGHLRRTLAEREQPFAEWHAFVQALFTEQPWCQRRGLEGPEAFVEALSAWQERQRGVLRRLPCSTLVLRDPHLDWPGTLDQLFATL